MLASGLPVTGAAASGAATNNTDFSPGFVRLTGRMPVAGVWTFFVQEPVDGVPDYGREAGYFSMGRMGRMCLGIDFLGIWLKGRDKSGFCGSALFAGWLPQSRNAGARGIR